MIPFCQSLWSDLRYAVRQLRKSPAFALSVIVTLTVAIGANTAIFSVVRAVLLQPLPYPEPQRLLCVWNRDVAGAPWYTFSHPGFLRYRERLAGSAELAAYDDEVVTVSDRGEPVRVEGGRVSANFFAVLGARPALGRGFLPSEDQHRANPVALLSDHFWRNRYHADPEVVGRAVTIDGEEFTIIGVMPPGFRFQSAEVDVWRSRIVDTRTFAPASVQLGAGYLSVVARLRAGVTLAQFRAQLAAVRDPDSRDDNFTADFLQRKLFAAVENTILVLWGAVACLLLIACANVANLVLARATARYRDISVRLALGAGRGRIAQQLIVESVFLSVCSAALSLPLSVGGMQWLTGALRRNSHIIPDATLDWGVLLFTLGIAAATGTLFGLAPMWMVRRGAGQAGLHSAGRGPSASKWSTRWRGAMVAAQLALSLALLAAAGLLAQSFLRVYTVSTGVRTDHVALFPLDLMPDRYETFDRRAAFYDEVLRRVGSIPGVKGVGIASRVDLVSYGLGYVVRVEGNTDAALQQAGTRGRSVSPDYFRVLGIPLLRGRTFDEHDTTHSAHVAIVNEAFVKKFFGGADPLGKHVVYSTDQIDCEIVGVVANVRAGLQDSGAADNLYLPLSQRPWLVARLLVRTERPAAMAAAIRENVRLADPAQAVAESEPLDQVISERLGQPRTTMMVVAAFAASALLLAAVGIYGAIAYSVAQRRKEIGIRMALGADARRVRALLFRQTLRTFGAGLLIGLPAAAALSRLYGSLLFDIQPGDPLTYAASVGLLIAVALLATYLPAKRASQTDPVTVLRME